MSHHPALTVFRTSFFFLVRIRLRSRRGVSGETDEEDTICSHLALSNFAQIFRLEVVFLSIALAFSPFLSVFVS